MNSNHMKKKKKKKQKAPVEAIKKEVKHIIKQPKNSEINYLAVPKEYQSDKNIIEVKRKLGVRNLGKRGYDIIRNVFFVEEELSDGILTIKEIKYFDDFESYSIFVNDEIYDDACYYQCDISKIGTSVDCDRLFERKSFVEDTIDDYTVTSIDIISYNKGEQIKNQCKNLIDKFNSCLTSDEFRKVNQNYRKSKLSTELVRDLWDWDSWDSYKQHKDFFMWQYIFSALKDKKRFNILMEYMSDYTCASNLVREICTVFNPDDVMAAYNFTDSSKQGIYKQKKRLKDIAEDIKNGFIDKNVSAFFDEVSHYYCEKCEYILQKEKTRRSEGKSRFCTYRFFETFEDFIKYRNNDLSNCDLTKAIKLNYDFTKCKINETTKLPFKNMDGLKYVVKKKYDNGKFKVLQEWYNSKNLRVKYYIHMFDYFFDFVAFMKGNLSGADLWLCNGLENLNDVSGINFKNAGITISTCNKLDIQYTPYELYKADSSRFKSFFHTEKNGKSAELEQQIFRKLDTSDRIRSLGNDMTKEQVYYISDIHLLHKLKYFEAESEDDVAYIIKSIVEDIVKESGNTILIGGDVCSDFAIFELFIKCLRNELDSKKYDTLVIFVLGNHELWGFPQNSFDEIVTKYDQLINDYGMHLLQNGVLYKDYDGVVHKITAKEILSFEDKDLRIKTRNSRITFFGGLAFSGYNEEFNADKGIYRDTIDKATEMKESKKFGELYKKICSAFSDRKLIVFTHMPMNCWSQNVDYHKNFIYVSGHTHRAYRYDDGDMRVYADNQIGYQKNNIHMKCFDIEYEYDCFANYDDGIYKITAQEYERFYRSKNLPLDFNWDVNILYLLKKNGYYCFIHESKGGSFTILNGGAKKKLGVNNVNYYYENMDLVIAFIKKPLDAYTNIQETISAEIRKIGGSGNIHGCIIDIDFFNHVYVNRDDKKVTGYWAANKINKEVYSSVPALLKQKRPDIYERYTKLLQENLNNLPILAKYVNSELDQPPQIYNGTEIYEPSREMNKMQRLNFNILTTWYEMENGVNMIESK